MPHHTEVSLYDDRWISDMQLAYQLYSHKKNNSRVMQMAENMRVSKKRSGLGGLVDTLKEKIGR